MQRERVAGHRLVNKAGEKDKSPICNKNSKCTQQTSNDSVRCSVP